MNEILLEGCRPEPLASYLKALAVFRLIGEQKDPRARAWWKDDRFYLRTKLTEDELVEFFLKEYSPTPLVAPWSGGSGFYAGDAREGLEAIRQSTDPRFSAYRDTIESIFSWSEFNSQDPTIEQAVKAMKEFIHRSGGKKSADAQVLLDDMLAPWGILSQEEDCGLRSASRYSAVETAAKYQRGVLSDFQKAFRKVRTHLERQKRGDAKEDLIPRSRSLLNSETLAWLDSVVAVLPSGRAVYGPILGTGGNEGRLDYSNNFMQRLSELLLSSDAPPKEWIRSALLGDSVFGLRKASVGQFDPGKAGGFNQGEGVASKDFKVNPWDFVLMLEGALFFPSAVSRRGAHSAIGWTAIPFTVTTRMAGIHAGSEGDEARAESWLPLWEKPAGLSELRHVFSEGRANVGRRIAHDGLDFARAVGTLGVDRGIQQFTRFAFLKRRGDSYVSLPAGRFHVRDQSGLDLLEELDPILRTIDGFLRRVKNVPQTYQNARRGIDDAMFSVCQRGDALSFRTLLSAIGRLEALIGTAGPNIRGQVRPLSGLSPRWISAAGPIPEVRLAAALASIGASGKVGSIRSNMEGTHPGKPWEWDSGEGQMEWRGATFAVRLSGLLRRRMMDASRLGVEGVPLYGRFRLRSQEVVPYLYGMVDDVLLEDLLWAFLWIDWRKEDDTRSEDWTQPDLAAIPIPRSYALIKMLFRPEKTGRNRIKADPRILGLLSAGRVQEACDLSLNRLRIEDLATRQADWGESSQVLPERLLSSLAFPVRDTETLDRLVLKRPQTKTTLSA